VLLLGNFADSQVLTQTLETFDAILIGPKCPASYVFQKLLFLQSMFKRGIKSGKKQKNQGEIW